MCLPAGVARAWAIIPTNAPRPMWKEGTLCWHDRLRAVAAQIPPVPLVRGERVQLLHGDTRRSDSANHVHRSACWRRGRPAALGPGMHTTCSKIQGLQHRTFNFPWPGGDASSQEVMRTGLKGFN